MSKCFLHLIVIGMLLVCAPAAVAGPDQDYAACDNSLEKDVFEVCTKVANDPNQSTQNRAIAYGNLSWGYIGTSDFVKALENAEISIALDDSNAFVFNNRGFSKFKTGKTDQAIADYGEAIKRDAKFIQAYINRGEIYFSRGEYQKAANDYSLIIKADSKNVDGWNNRGAALTKLKQYEKALADLNQAIKLNPTYTLAYANRVEANYNLGRIDKAVADAEALVKRFPNDGEAHNIRSWIRMQRGDVDGAIIDADKAVGLAPNDSNFLDTRGAAFLAKGRNADAVTDFSKAIELSPEGSNLYRQRAEAKLALSDFDGAKADAERALALKPDDAEGLKTMNSVQAAMLIVSRNLVQTPPAQPAAKLQGQMQQENAVETSVAPKPVTLANLGRRVALVIGNGAYPGGMSLPNPVNDAKAIAEALKRLGFDIVLVTNATKTGMSDAMYEFAVKAEGADAAVVFYAGHGMQVDGANYLMPVDGSVETKADLKHKFVAADDILDDLKSVKGMRVLVLDACRNNPLSRSIKIKLAAVASRAVDNRAGLADMKAEGVLIAFATQPNEVATDGAGANSPFTMALLKHIETPNIEIDTMFKRVRTTASEMTEGVQLPQTVNSSTGEFYLKPE